MQAGGASIVLCEVKWRGLGCMQVDFKFAVIDHRTSLIELGHLEASSRSGNVTLERLTLNLAWLVEAT